MPYEISNYSSTEWGIDMTREEAIRILDPETTGEALAEIEYYNGFSGKTAAVQAVSDACVLAVAALREQEERRWIPVTERMPEDALPKDSTIKQIKVLVAYKTNGRLVERTQIRVKGYWHGEPDKWSWVKTSDPISHWMPLPKPPKEVS